MKILALFFAVSAVSCVFASDSDGVVNKVVETVGVKDATSVVKSGNEGDGLLQGQAGKAVAGAGRTALSAVNLKGIQGLLSGGGKSGKGNQGLLQGQAGEAVAGVGRNALSIVKLEQLQALLNGGGKSGKKNQGLVQGQTGEAVSGVANNVLSAVSLKGLQELLSGGKS
ncbi:hypothetical protein TKK_0018361 [Trichogramma kaykai]